MVTSPFLRNKFTANNRGRLPSLLQVKPIYNVTHFEIGFSFAL